jgi:hypothetical protein
VDEDLRREWLCGAAVYGVAPAPISPRDVVSSIDPQAGRDLMGRRRTMGRMNGTAAWAWRLNRLGALGCAACVAINAAWWVRKRFGRRPTESDLVVDIPLGRIF